MKKFKINLEMKIHKTRDPFFHIIIDNFFNPRQLKKLLLDWPTDKKIKWNSTRKKINKKINLLESGIKSLNDTSKLSKNWKNFFNFIHHDNTFSNCIRNIVKDKKIVPDATYNWSGLKENLPGSYQLIHSDAIVHPTTDHRKRFTVMIYFDNQELTKKGNLELWDNKMKKCKVSIRPCFNRLVIFENTSTSYHGVPECNYLRRAFTMSFVDPTIKRSSLRNKAQFVARPVDSKKIAEQGILRGKVI